MPKQSSKAEINAFTAGFISEANPVNFPANASLDEINFELDRTGIRKRRLGFDLEEDGELINLPSGTDISTQTPITYKWRSVSGNVDKSFLVVQVSNHLLFFDLSESILSTSGYLGTLTITDFPTDTRFSFTSCDGSLVVASGLDKVGLVEYDLDTTTFSYSFYRLKTRDLWGVEVPDFDVENRPNTRPEQFYYEHYYNLQNQSWGVSRRDILNNLADPVLIFHGHFGGRGDGVYNFDPGGGYPSNSDVVWTGLQYQAVSKDQTPFERVYPALYKDSSNEKEKAPVGFYVIDALRRGESRMEEFSFNNNGPNQFNAVKSISLKSDFTPGGPTCVTEFAGRIFYAGFSGEVIDGDSRSPNYTNYIFFSQLINKKQDYGKCYQVGDPTSRDGSDVVDTDGGFIRVSGVEKIISIINLSSSLIVIGTNGIWSISGGSGYGFSAANYQVDRISSYGGLSPYSIVEDQGRAYYWSEDGIYVIGKNQFGEFDVKSMTEQTIQTFYKDIPSNSKLSSVGVYDPLNKKIRWIYNLGTVFNQTSFVQELIFDLLKGSFTKNSISYFENTEVMSLFPTLPFRTSDFLDIIFSGTDQVFSLTDEVVTTGINRVSEIQSIKYLCVIKDGSDYKIGFGLYRDAEFVDWKSVDGIGIDAKAFIIGGMQIVSDSSIFKQIPYMTTHFIRTETIVDENLEPLTQSSCMSRIQWDWADKYLSNRWSPLRQIYRYAKPPKVSNQGDDYDNGLEVLTTKNKVRGRGRSFAVYFETEPKKDCQIISWSLALNGNQYV